MVLETDGAVFVVQLFQHGQVVVGAGDLELAALGVMRVDPFELADAANVVDRVVHRQRDRSGGVTAVAGRELRRRVRETGEAPAAVASRGAEPGDLLLDHDDLQRRLALQQVVGGPETGKPGAEDRYIGLNRSVQRRTRRQIVAAVFEPEAVRGVVLHGRLLIIQSAT